jgi:hypothetical protein
MSVFPSLMMPHFHVAADPVNAVVKPRAVLPAAILHI